MNAQKIQDAAAVHPKPRGVKYQYGTAGFRTTADVLDSVMFRLGLLAALRSRKLDGKTIGVMITASHNPAKDNGAKLVDPRGEMLEASWEGYATTLANAEDKDVFDVISEIAVATKTNFSKPASVIFAHDTRPSGPLLVKALQDGLNAAEAENLMFEGLLTTPQLHYLVRCHNTKDTPGAYGEPTEEGYYKKLADAFKTICSKIQHPSLPLTVDCANGVGAPKLEKLAEHIGKDLLPVKIIYNDIHDEAALNNGCGADFVKTNQKAPNGLSLTPGACYCSFDGDADRIVFYYQDEEDGLFKLLDGDKIATLAAMFIKELIKESDIKDLDLSLVQTAYANGSSTKYVKNVLNVPVTCTATGVKHLHHAAEKSDIGVYFEANGHGTILFSNEAISTIRAIEPTTPAHQESLETFLALTDLINQTVGDAMSDMLLVVAILSQKQWEPKFWNNSYTDLPNRLVKVIVKDRTQFNTTDAERQLLTPEGLQANISTIVGKYQQGRSFVRPSGTEDCVRVYAEAATRAEADELAFKVAGLIFDFAGTGPRPAEFL